MKTAIHQLSSLDAPKDVFGVRGLAPETRVLSDLFWDGYDNTTLIYDTIWQEAEKRLRIYFPKLLGFRRTIINAQFRIDGNDVRRTRLREFRQFDVLDIPSPAAPQRLELSVKDQKIPLSFSTAEPDRFAGKNVLYTKVKNDRLDWIRDWATAHQRNHGANAIIMTNNASTSYSSEDLRAALAAIPGIEVADVLDGPHSHGPHPSSCEGTGWARFQQKSHLNIVRDRFLTRARAVLLCDVDELVAGPPGRSIFDATANSWTKYMPFSGAWRFSDTRTPRHADHIFAYATEKPCPGKYCIVPDSLLGRSCWAVHSLENVNRRLFPPMNSFGYYHCHGISTSWKYDRQKQQEDELHVDPETQAFLSRTFDQ